MSCHRVIAQRGDVGKTSFKNRATINYPQQVQISANEKIEYHLVMCGLLGLLARKAFLRCVI